MYNLNVFQDHSHKLLSSGLHCSRLSRDIQDSIVGVLERSNVSLTFKDQFGTHVNFCAPTVLKS